MGSVDSGITGDEVESVSGRFQGSSEAKCRSPDSCSPEAKAQHW